MAKGTITSFTVNAATNGFTISYCVKTKLPMQAGQTYANTDYNDQSLVFGADEGAKMIASIKKLCGIIEDDAKEGATSIEDSDSDVDYPILKKG